MKRTSHIAAALWLAMAIPAIASPGGGAHSHDGETAYGEPGDPSKPARVVNIAMREADGKMLFVPNQIEVRTGEQIRFVVRNNGELEHEIVVATFEENEKHAIEMRKNPDMEHDDPNARRLDSKKSGEMIWKFTKAGEFEFACLIPGHRESGMHGKIVVK